MLPNNEPNTGRNNIIGILRDSADAYGVDEIVDVCAKYFYSNLKRQLSDEERRFCRELFGAMYYASTNNIEPSKLVYPLSLTVANERLESRYFYENRKLNEQCAKDIDALIRDSCYKQNFYNCKIAAMIAILKYGFHRTCLVLGFNYQNKGIDARLTETNRKWASEFILQEGAFEGSWLQSHATLVDAFCGYVRELYQDFGAENCMLLGSTPNGEFNGKFEIRQKITTSDDGNGFLTGYVVANYDMMNHSWICWQFAVRNGEYHYNWGHYCEDEQSAVDYYNARVFVALNRCE